MGGISLIGVHEPAEEEVVNSALSEGVWSGRGYHRMKDTRIWSKGRIEICQIKQEKKEYSRRKEQHISSEHTH